MLQRLVIIMSGQVVALMLDMAKGSTIYGLGIIRIVP